MIFRDVFSVLPIQFYAVVLALAAAYLIWMLVELFFQLVSISKLRKELAEIESNISMHQGCNIENLPLISDVFESVSPNIKNAYNQLIQAATDYYDKKWIPSPDNYLNVATVASPLTNRFVRGHRHHLFMLIGFLISVFSFIIGFVFFSNPNQIVATIVLSSIPILVAILFAVIYLYATAIWRQSLDTSFHSVYRSLEHKIPVFSENKGISQLVSQFIDYDRNMTQAVESLSDKIDQFTMGGLTSAVTDSIEGTLRESVFPSIERANDAIVGLAKDILVREDEGMKSLSLSFVSVLSSELTYHFKPFFEQIESVSQTLSESKRYMDVISQTINIYKQNAQELHGLTALTLKDYSTARQTFAADVSGIATSLSEYGKINREYVEKINGDMQNFERSVSILGDKMEEGNKRLTVMLEAVFVEAKNSEENALKAQENASSYLDQMRSQITQLSSEMSTINKELVTGLSQRMNDFFARQDENVIAQQEKITYQATTLLASMENSASKILDSSSQISVAFNELEEARAKEAESKTKKSFFRR